MSEEKVKIEPDYGSVPEKGTTYFYVRSCMQTHRFKVYETQWFGGMSDVLRLAKGNLYFTQKEANAIMLQLNVRVDKLAAILGQQKVLEERKREQERIKAELEEKNKKKEKKPKKELRPAKIQIPLSEKVAAYERNKKKRQHPDVLD